MTTTRLPRIEPISRQAPLVVALVPAAGRGLRMGGSVPKQFLSLGSEPLIVQSLRTLQAAPVVDQIVLAVPRADVEYCDGRDRLATSIYQSDEGGGGWRRAPGFGAVRARAGPLRYRDCAHP